TTDTVFLTDTNNLKNVDPMLGPLAFNGGPTQTHALLAGSPAIDKGSNPAALTTDQRGAPFVRVSGPQADIGAYEKQATPVMLVVTTAEDEDDPVFDPADLSLREALRIAANPGP